MNDDSFGPGENNEQFGQIEEQEDTEIEHIASKYRLDKPFGAHTEDVFIVPHQSQVEFALDSGPDFDVADVKTTLDVAFADQHRTVQSLIVPLENVLSNAYPLLACRTLSARLESLAGIFKSKRFCSLTEGFVRIVTVRQEEDVDALQEWQWRLSALPRITRGRQLMYLGLAMDAIKAKASLRRRRNQSDSGVSKELVQLGKLRDEKRRLDQEEQKLDAANAETCEELGRLEFLQTDEERFKDDKSLDLIMLDREIARLKAENKNLSKEIRETGQDTRTLLRQVGELLQSSDQRHRQRRKHGEGELQGTIHHQDDLRSDR